MGKKKIRTNKATFDVFVKDGVVTHVGKCEIPLDIRVKNGVVTDIRPVLLSARTVPVR